MPTYDDTSRKRNIDNIEAGEILTYGSSDGGTTWYPIKVSEGVLVLSSDVKTYKSLSGQVSSIGDNDLVSLVSGKKIKVYAYSLTTESTSAVTCIFKTKTTGTEIWRVKLKAITGSISGANLACNAPRFLFTTLVGEGLVLNLSIATAVDWAVVYWDNDAT